MSLFMKYKICLCPHCHEISNTFAEKTFRCIYCRKSTKFQYEREPGLQVRVLFHTNNPQEAAKVCGKAKLKLAQGGYKIGN